VVATTAVVLCSPTSPRIAALASASRPEDSSSWAGW